MNVSKPAFAFLASAAFLLTTAAAQPAAARVLPQASPTIAPILPEQDLSEIPASARRFVDSVGIDSTYELGEYTTLTTNQLIWSHIHHLRDSSLPYKSYIAQMAYLGQHGIYHSIIETAGFAPDDLRMKLAAFAPYVDMVEPKNEADYAGNWAQMRSDQANIWNTMRSNPAWNNIMIDGPSFYSPGQHAPLVGPLDQYEDVGNMHTLPCDWNPGTAHSPGIAGSEAALRSTTVHKPIVTTEGGYTDDMVTRTCGMTDNAIAKYLPRTSTERFIAGEPRTYFLFLNNTSSPRFGNMGLLQNDGTAKPQFLALANLTRLLDDNVIAQPATPVAYSLTGVTADVHHLLLARSDGTYDLVIYREVESWNHSLRAPNVIAPLSVQVSFPGMNRAVLYQYNSNNSLVGATVAVSNNQTANFPVTDTISVIHIKP